MIPMISATALDRRYRDHVALDNAYRSGVPVAGPSASTLNSSA
jgi:hypothetical protein